MAPAKRARLDTDDRYNPYPGAPVPPSCPVGGGGGYQARNHHSGGSGGYGYHASSHGGGGGHYSGGSSFGGGSGSYLSSSASRAIADANNLSVAINDPTIFLSFKAFLMALPEELNELESVKRYNEYKINFKKVQAKSFFDDHKDEEWFRSKYRPLEREQSERDQRAAWQNRLRTFMSLIENGWLDRSELSLDIKKAADVRKFLDAFVIKLLGGTDEDLKALELSDYNSKDDNLSDMQLLSEETEKLRKSEALGQIQPTAAQTQSSEIINGEPSGGSTSTTAAVETKVKMETDTITPTSHKDTSQDEDQGIDCADTVLDTKIQENQDQDHGDETKNDIADETSAKVDTLKDVVDKVLMPSSISLRSVHPSATREEVIRAARELAPEHFLRVAFAEPLPPKFYRRAYVTYRHMSDDDLKNICWKFSSVKFNDQDTLPCVYNLPKGNQRIKAVSGLFEHKSVVRADIKNVVDLIMIFDKKRKIWYKPSEQTNVVPGDGNREDQDASVESQQQQNSAEGQDQCVTANQQDDSRDEQDDRMETNENQDQNKGKDLIIEIVGENPLLENIKDYLIEETSTEEMELIGSDDREEGEAESFHTVRDETLIKVLDKLILYLRCVHSFDYYSVNEYHEEDMPHPLLYFSARGSTGGTPVTLSEINDIIKQHATKLKRFTDEICLTESELKQLGKLDAEVAIEEFIQKNTNQLSENKYECLLSKKKFKGPEFVRKHILNKQQDALNEIRTDVEFFNNYLADPRRPNNDVIPTKYVKPHVQHSHGHPHTHSHQHPQDDRMGSSGSGTRESWMDHHGTSPQWPPRQGGPRQGGPYNNRRSDQFGHEKFDYHHRVR